MPALRRHFLNQGFLIRKGARAARGAGACGARRGEPTQKQGSREKARRSAYLGMRTAGCAGRGMGYRRGLIRQHCTPGVAQGGPQRGKVAPKGCRGARTPACGGWSARALTPHVPCLPSHLFPPGGLHGEVIPGSRAGARWWTHPTACQPHDHRCGHSSSTLLK